MYYLQSGKWDIGKSKSVTKAFEKVGPYKHFGAVCTNKTTPDVIFMTACVD